MGVIVNIFSTFISAYTTLIADIEWYDLIEFNQNW